MKIGIVGLPNVGKSTLFNAITQAGVESANYPFCTIEPNVGVVTVPDQRLEKLAQIFNSKRIVPTTIEFYDIAGLVKGASQGEGLGNKFLSHIREVEAIAHVIRCFDNDEIIHVDGSIDPLRDIETIDLELMLADMEILERRIQKSQKAAKGDKSLAGEVEIIEKTLSYLTEGKSLRSQNLSPEEIEFLKPFNLLSLKPIIYVANVSEEDLLSHGQANIYIKKINELARAEGAEVILISAQIEEEIAELDPVEKAEFLKEMGLKESGLDRLIKASYRLLNLISFLTAGPMESKAWTVRRKTPAPKAAGKIHSDIERGFIRAEVITYQDLITAGNMATAREKGLLRIEGKEYLLQDGDVVHFRFNV